MVKSSAFGDDSRAASTGKLRLPPRFVNSDAAIIPRAQFEKVINSLRRAVFEIIRDRVAPVKALLGVNDDLSD